MPFCDGCKFELRQNKSNNVKLAKFHITKAGQFEVEATFELFFEAKKKLNILKRSR